MRGNDHNCDPHPQGRCRNHPIPAVVRAPAEQEEQNPNDTAHRHEPLVRHLIENPHAIKRCPSPKESNCCETCHNRSKEQENAYRIESRAYAQQRTSCAKNMSTQQIMNNQSAKTSTAVPELQRETVKANGFGAVRI